jgi:hypothetical protein
VAREAAGNRTGEVRMLYNPYQQAFLKARRLRLDDGSRAFHRFTLVAGRRGGKTFIGAVAICEELSVPNVRGWAVAPTYEELHDYVIPQVFETIPHGWIQRQGWSEQHKELKLRNGALLQFRSGEDPERMRGPGLNFLWFDEIRKIRKKTWMTARPMLTERRGAAYFTTSPNGFDWVYKDLYSKALIGPLQRKGYWATRYRTIDNPAIPKEEVEEARETMDPLFFAQEYEAEFVSFEGAIYGTAVEPCVLRTNAEVQEYIPEWPSIPTTWPCIIGQDMGTDHPYAAVKLLVTPKGIVAIGEYLRRVASFHEHATELKRLAEPHYSTPNADLRWAMDRTALQAQIELAQHGIYSMPSESNVTAGIQRVQSWLRSRQLLFVEALVPNLVQQMKSYHWTESINRKGEKNPERPYKFDEDLCDGLRYGVMLWPELPQILIPDSRRRIETVPEECRWAYQRMRELDERKNEDETDWSTDLSPIGEMFAND